MIIFLYGEDSYRSRQKLNEIIEEYKKIHKSGLNFKFFDFDEPNVSVESLINEFRQNSMFKEKKLAIIANLFLNPEQKEIFRKNINAFADSDNILIIYEKMSIGESCPLFKDLKKNKKVKKQEFRNLVGFEIRNWIKKEIEKRKVEIEPMAFNLLLNYVSDDLWLISNELDKLVNFKKTIKSDSFGKVRIEEKDIKLLIKPKIEKNIFKLIDALAQKNKKAAIRLINWHLENGDTPTYLLAMIGYQFKNLLIVKELKEKNKSYNIILKESGIHSFALKKTYSQANYFSLNELKKIYRFIFEIDLKMKTGAINQEAALEMLVALI